MENTLKSKKSHLAHELGSGSPCEKCKSKCQGFDLHYWRKRCKNCLCSIEDHGIVEDDEGELKHICKLFDSSSFYLNKNKISEFFNKNLNISRVNDSRSKCENQCLVTEQDDRLNNSSQDNEIQVSKNTLAIDSTSNKRLKDNLERKKLIKAQFPKHDLDFEQCHDLSPSEKKKMMDFVTKCRNNVGVGIPCNYDQNNTVACKLCVVPFEEYDMIVTTEKITKGFWHSSCFKCSICAEQLVDLIYFSNNDDLLCGRHFGNLNFERCAACDELIFTDLFTKAENKNWHLKHFCCYKCDGPLAGKDYALSKNGLPCCLNCLIEICSSCHGPIASSARRISFRDKHWHAAEKCFHCSVCNISLFDKKFMVCSDKIICSVKCKKNILP